MLNSGYTLKKDKSQYAQNTNQRTDSHADSC